jgi:hypothetical protein
MFHDAFRRELKQGDYLTYGKSFGRCAGLGIARVLTIRETMEEKFNRETWTYDTLPSGQFVLDVMTLQGWRPIEKPERCSKTTLQFEERVLRLNPEDIPQEQRAVLDTAYNTYLAQMKAKEERK